MDYRQILRETAARYGVDPDLAEAAMAQESGGNPSARSKAGAFGLMQLMPGTAKELGVDPSDPVQNIDGGVRYLKQQIDKFGVAGGLAAYNAGPGRVSKTDNFNDLPAETRNYVPKIMERAAKLKDSSAAPKGQYTLEQHMAAYTKAQAAGDAEASSEIAKNILSLHQNALQKAQAAGDTEAVAHIQQAMEPFAGSQATQASPAPQKTPVEAPKAPSEPSLLGKVGKAADNFVRGAADALTFGYADEIAAGLDSAVGGGQSGKASYDEALAAHRQRDKEGGGARLVGQVAGAFVPTGLAIRAADGASKLSRVTAGAKMGAVQGGLYGSGSAEGGVDDRFSEAGKGAVLGGALGAVAPAVIPLAKSQKVNRFVKEAGGEEAAKVDAELIQRIKAISENPNLRGQPVRAQQLNAVANGYIKEASEAAKAVGNKDVQKALQGWHALTEAEIAALRGSPLGDAVADNILKAQRVRSLTAEQEATGGVAKLARSVSGWVLPERLHFGLKAVMGGGESRKQVTEKLLKNADVASAVTEKLGPSKAATASDNLAELVTQAQQRKSAQVAAAKAAKASKETNPAVAIAEQQAKDPSFIIGLGNKLGAPRNEAQMAEFSKVLRHQMESREALRAAQKATAAAKSGTDPAAQRVAVLQGTRRPLSGAFQELLPGGRSNLNLNSKEAVDALRLTSRQLKTNPVGQAAKEILKSGNVKNEDAFYGLQNHLRKLQEQGALAGGPASPGALTGHIRNPVSYAANVRNAEAAVDIAVKSAPSKGLQQFARTVAGTKDPADKLKLLQDRLAKAKTPQEAEYLNTFVEPLTKYGKK